jgi:hypothetical protein
MAVDTKSFFPQWLDANRQGRLSEQQRRNLGGNERSNRKTELSWALFALAVGAIILFVPGLREGALVHYGVPFVCVLVAIGIAAWSLMGADPLQHDLNEGKVASVDGPIGKRHSTLASGSHDSTVYFLDVGPRTFTVSVKTYEAAPDAGWVRLYYLPRTKRVVNFERIEGGHVAHISSPEDMVREARASMSFDRVKRNDARADIQTLTEQMEAGIEHDAQPPAPGARDAGALAEAIVGTWHSMMMTVTFRPDGTVEATMLGGMHRSGHWSIDADGRLHSDVMGQDGAADAWMEGETLVISLDGNAIKLDRVTADAG